MPGLTDINYNAEVQENTGTFIAVPDGFYKAVLIGEELKENSKNTGMLLILNWQIIEGEYTGTVIIDRLNITNQSKQAQDIAQGTLKRILNIFKAKYPPESEDMSPHYGKELMIKVIQQEFKSNVTGKDLKSNKIKKYDFISKVQPEQKLQNNNMDW